MPSVGDLVHALPANNASSTSRALLDVAVLLAGSGAPKSTTRSRLLEFLPKYRNEHFHGGISRVDEDARAARVLLAGIEAAWQEGLFWTPSNALVYVDAVEIDSFGRRRAHVFVLEGLASQAELPDESLHSVEDQVLPGRVYLRAETRYRSLHPWLVYDDGRVLFFNGMKGRGAKYLDYAKNDHVPSKSLLGKLPQLDADLAALFGSRPEPRAAEAAEAPAEDEKPESSPQAPETVRSGERRRGRAPWRLVALGVAGALVVAGGVTLAMRSGADHGAPRIEATPSASAAASVAPVPAGELDVPVISARAPVQAEFRRAVEELLAADIESSEHGFRQVAADEPDQPWPHVGLGLAYALEQRFDESYLEQERARDLAGKGKGDPRDRRLIELVHGIDLPTFAASSREYLAQNPRYFLAQLMLAYYGMEQGSREERLGRFETALAIDDRHPITYLAKVWALLRLNERDAAKAALGAGLARRATAPWLLDQRGVLRMADGDMQGAKQDFLAAMSNHGPAQSAVHYAMALLRSGVERDAPPLKTLVDSMLAETDPEQRADAACQVVMALYARGKVRDADGLLHAVLDERPGTEPPKAGTSARCLLLPLWVDDALGRFAEKDARWRLDSLRALFHRPQLSKDDIGSLQWSDTALHGLAAAETGHLGEAEQELRSLSEDTATAQLHEILVSDLSARIQLVTKRPVTVREAQPGAGLALRARVAHLQGRVAERDKDDAAAAKAYGVLATMAPECANSEAAFALPCAAYAADGLARLAALQARHAQPEELARTVAAFDALWPKPDPDLAAAKAIRALRRTHP